ncbi:unnamed protein product [Parnassius apollo]|uniref:(apollo) hypothetical protein n=1 Tax=Parnassius apollo TaxID=110799 RepID=A0A8S3WCM8_PARAO|nr:unnamed protein product [Parnassius apollo]
MICQKNSYNQRPNSPVPGPSGLQQANSSQPFDFTPKDLRPLPQASPRTVANKGRKKRKTAILTDTPEKNAIEEEYQRRNKAKKTVLQPDTRNGKGKLISTKGKGKGKKTKKAVKGKENKSDDEDCFCLVCLETFSNSRPNEQWIQCTKCKMWSHAECVNDDANYECHNCELE